MILKVGKKSVSLTKEEITKLAAQGIISHEDAMKALGVDCVVCSEELTKNETQNHHN
jgi:hypothetical protein